jgi:hypothetical protein
VIPQVGTEVKFKVGDVEQRGVITEVNVSAESIEVTSGGHPDGPPTDRWRIHAPGRTSVSITVELEP